MLIYANLCYSLLISCASCSVQEYLLGHGLSDDHPTITHHYARSEGEESLVYPSFPSGWALSPPLLKR